MNYDLSDSHTITFRSIKMRIVEFSNDSITYKVIKDNDLPWLPY